MDYKKRVELLWKEGPVKKRYLDFTECKIWGELHQRLKTELRKIHTFLTGAPRDLAERT